MSCAKVDSYLSYLCHRRCRESQQAWQEFLFLRLFQGGEKGSEGCDVRGVCTSIAVSFL